MTEIWRPVSGYEGWYEVSNLGNVRSLDREIEQWSMHGHRSIREWVEIILEKMAKETPSGWISVKDRLPEIHQHVITFDTVHGMRVDWLSKEREWAWGYHTTHWMPLPEPPKEGDAE